LLQKQITFNKNLSKGKPYSYIFDNKVQNEFLNTYGYHVNSLEMASFFPTTKVGDDGSIILSSGDIKNLRGMPGLISESVGSRSKYSTNNKLFDVLPKEQSAYDYVKDALDSGKRV